MKRGKGQVFSLLLGVVRIRMRHGESQRSRHDFSILVIYFQSKWSVFPVVVFCQGVWSLRKGSKETGFFTTLPRHDVIFDEISSRRV